MSDALEAEFHHRVRAAYKDYLDERASGKTGTRRDLRAALNAAKALYHWLEHLPSTHATTWRAVASKCSDFALLRDVVDTDKHHKLADQTREVCNSHQIEERVSITEYKDPAGVYRHVEKGVILHLTNGGTHELVDVLTNVINFWQDELHALGLMRKLAAYPSPHPAQPLPRAACNDARIDFEILQGVEFKQTWQFQRYNYNTGRIEPENLTGADFRFTIYKPRYELEIKLRKEETGKELSRKASLSADEFERFKALPTDGEKQKYLMSLPGVRVAFDEAQEEAKRIDASEATAGSANDVSEASNKE